MYTAFVLAIVLAIVVVAIWIMRSDQYCVGEKQANYLPFVGRELPLFYQPQLLNYSQPCTDRCAI